MITYLNDTILPTAINNQEKQAVTTTMALLRLKQSTFTRHISKGVAHTGLQETDGKD